MTHMQFELQKKTGKSKDRQRHKSKQKELKGSEVFMKMEAYTYIDG